MTSTKATTLDEARRFLADIKQGVACSEDLIPCRETRYGDFPIAQIYETFGYRGVRCNQLVMQLAIARQCSIRAAGDLADAGRITSRLTHKDLAVALHWRLGACNELATLAWFKTGFWRVTTGPRLLTEIETAQQLEQVGMAHSFVMCNLSTGQLGDGDKLSRLYKLHKAIVIDPFFNFACIASQLKTEAPALLDYWKAHGHQYIIDCRIFEDFPRNRELALREAALIYQESQKYVEEAQQALGIVALRLRLSSALSEQFKPQFDQALAVLVPGTRWTIKLKDDGNYDLTTRDKLQETTARLTQLGIRHTLIAGIAISLRNPDPEVLTVKALSEDQVVEWTGLQAPQARLILRLVA
jgi:hypothetical protein